MGEQTVPAENFMQTLSVNVDNDRLSDSGFRELVRNTLPIVIFQRVAAEPSDTFVDQAPQKQSHPTNRAGLIRAVRQESLDLHRSHYMRVLDDFSMASFSVAWLSDMPESRLRELLEEIRRSNQGG